MTDATKRTDTTKRILGVIAAVFVAVVATVEVVAVKAEEISPVAVGVILPLSGPVAEYGVAAKNGLLLAQEEHPELFPRIKFVFADSQYDSKIALSSFQKLRDVDDISLVYVWGYGPSQALIPVAEQSQFPAFAVSADTQILKGTRWTLRFCYRIDEIASLLHQHFRANNFHRVGIIKTDIAYMDGLVDSLNKRSSSGDSLEVVESYQPSDNDFRQVITKLKAKNLDAYGVFLISGQISQFYRQARQLRLGMTSFGTDFFDSRKEVGDAQGTMEGAVFAAPIAEPEFVDRYTKRFGNDLQLAWAANAYEFAVLTGELLGGQRNGSSAEVLLAKFRSVRVRGGSAASYAYVSGSEGSGFHFKVGLRKVSGNQILDIP